MESVKKEIENYKIGTIEYSFDAEIYFHEGSYSRDTTEGEDEELSHVDIGPITAFNTETEEEYKVTDKSEANMVKEWFKEVAMDYKNGYLS